MPDVYLTRRPFTDIPEDIADIVSRIEVRWFAGARWLQRKDAVIGSVSVRDRASISTGAGLHCILLVLAVRFLQRDGPGDRVDLYNVPLVIGMSGDEGSGQPLVAIKGPGYEAVVYDGTTAASFASAVLNGLKREARIAALQGTFEFFAIGPGVPGEVRGTARLPDTSTNTIVTIDSSQIMKVYRRMVPGVPPDLEMSVHLTKAGFRHIPPATGYAAYRAHRGGTYPLLVMQQFVPNQGDAWQMALADAASFLRGSQDLSLKGAGPGDEGRQARLGAITAELHRVCAGIDDDAFRPERVRSEDVTALAQELASSMRETMRALRHTAGQHTVALASKIREVAGQEAALAALVEQACRDLTSSRNLGKRIRIHGDLHLGQFLRTEGNDGPDFVVIDFEGEPLRTAEERRRKSSPLRDVAGMLRSFDYAGYSAAFEVLKARRGSPGPGEEVLSREAEPVQMAKAWARRAGEAFLTGYLGESRGDGSRLLPAETRDLRLMLTCFKLEKALYEVRYEMGNRPHWVGIPLAGVLDCLEELRALVNSLSMAP